MTVVAASDKFEGNQIQACVIAGGYVILRAIYRQQNVVLMTATANESSAGRAVPSYPGQAALIETAERIFHEVGGDVTRRRDRAHRPYVQSIYPDAWAKLSDIAERVATALGLGEIQIVRDSALADFWQDVAQNPHDEDELVYLGDGTYVDKDGRLVEQ